MSVAEARIPRKALDEHQMITLIRRAKRHVLVRKDFCLYSAE
jgi:hypothetical protein